MKLPTTLLQTLAVAVASIGVAGCGSATSNEPTNPSPAPAVVDPQGNTTPQQNAPGCDDLGIKPKGGESLDGCPACGRG
jgi:hypothetical protein